MRGTIGALIDESLLKTRDTCRRGTISFVSREELVKCFTQHARNLWDSVSPCDFERTPYLVHCKIVFVSHPILVQSKSHDASVIIRDTQQRPSSVQQKFIIILNEN